MSKIIITVPNGNNCKGCEYLAVSYRENRNRNYEIVHSCQIFKTEIFDFQKCIGCKICAIEGD